MQNLSSDLQQRASGIKLLILDVDGVLTGALNMHDLLMARIV